MELRVKALVEDERQYDLELQLQHKHDEIAVLKKKVAGLERDLGLVRSEHEKQVTRLKLSQIAELADARQATQNELDQLRRGTLLAYIPLVALRSPCVCV